MASRFGAQKWGSRADQALASEAHLARAMVYLSENQPAEAAAEFRRASELDPDGELGRQALDRARALADLP